MKEKYLVNSPLGEFVKNVLIDQYGENGWVINHHFDIILNHFHFHIEYDHDGFFTIEEL